MALAHKYMSIRFGEVELMRFLAAMMVLNVHTRCYAGCDSLVPGGYLGVEFFFLLSGYLMASQVHKQATAAPPSCPKHGVVG